MDGIILIDKEKNMTSRDVVNIISKKLHTKKVGHFGTLDPLATGLLVIGVGAYTKAETLFEDETKKYEAEVLIGKQTDTYDITGKTIKEEQVDIKEEELKKVLKSFKGKYIQEVPIYSAVKVNGKKLYEYARKNEKVDLPKKEIEIIDIKFGKLYKKDENLYFNFKCHVSKGTYIRSLINDISQKMNIPMCMSDLRRTKCGIFNIEDSISVKSVIDNNYKMLTISKFLDIEEIEVPKSIEQKVKNGSMIEKISNKYILFTKDGKKLFLYGIYKNGMKPYLTFKN